MSEYQYYEFNGRTARALFYWAMINEGYWLAEFISIRCNKKGNLRTS
jgi:Fic family protein